MHKRSTTCTLYSAYMTLDDPRGAPDPAGTLRGPPERTIYHDRYWPAQHGLQACSQRILESDRTGPRARQHAPHARPSCSRTPHTSRPSMHTRWCPLRGAPGAKRYL